jgi:hAT family C-terminal dimerisation region
MASSFVGQLNHFYELQPLIWARIYPALAVLLRIFATLPVTTATGERSFSALKYLTNYLRSTMG